MEKPQTLEELLESCPSNGVIIDGLVKAWSVINNPQYSSILCSVSGGSDSDIVMDIVWKCDKDNKVTYAWYNTGMEYQATKDHLVELEEKYGVEILRKRPAKPVPINCKTYGRPFVSKTASEYMSRLQKHGFTWEDKPFEILIQEYPNCKSALEWWCNRHRSQKLNIKNNKWLKEFLIQNPPTFRISEMCCEYSKLACINQIKKEKNYQLEIVGIRKSEGGQRATLSSCFNKRIPTDTDKATKGKLTDVYRPLFWYKQEDKRQYETTCLINHSNCYTKYGLKRTGCAGCPFGQDFEQELESLKLYEPKLFAAANAVFKESYEYTRKYRAFQQQMGMGRSRK